MRVRIFKPAKSSMQSGRAKTLEWAIQPELLTARTPEPVMGWSRSGDTLAELAYSMRFATKEEAVSFAERQGWDCVVEEPAERKIRPRSYLDNFRAVRPQDEEKRSSN